MNRRTSSTRPHRVTLIPGDGTGPELVREAVRVLGATGAPLEWEEQEAGESALERGEDPLPASVLESLRRNRVGLKGPISTPSGGGHRSVNVRLRQELDLFACLRPIRSLPGVRTPFPDLDLVIVRENTEDVYAGTEFAAESPAAAAVREWAERHTGRALRPDSAIALKAISRSGSERIARFAFEYAVRHRRRRVTAVHKANILKETDGLFLATVGVVARQFPEIEFNDHIVDSLCMRLVQDPRRFDVLVMPNLYGDIVSDLVAGLAGGLGIAPGANFGEEIALFEPTHGSAPAFRGQNRLNPTAAILSGALLLRHLGEPEAADRVEAALARVIAEGREVTFDLKAKPDDPTAVGTREMASAVIREMAVSSSLSSREAT